MVTPIRPRNVVSTAYSPTFEKFLLTAPDSVKANCELRKVRVAFDHGMRLVRVFNWPSDVEDTLEVVNQTGCCTIYAKEKAWNNACSTPLLLPCPGDYEIRLPDNDLLPREALLQEQKVDPEACACILAQVQVHI